MQNDTTFTVNGTSNGCARRLSHAAFFLSLVSFMLLAPAYVAQAAAPKANNTRIVSEKMTYDANKNQVVFEGKVHVVRPGMEIWSEILTVVLDNSDKKPTTASNNALGAAGKVDRIIAEKNVRIKQDNKNGTCGKATYYVNAGKILMEQSPLLVDGENRIRGRIINYYTQTGKSEVIGNVDVQFSTGDNVSPSLPGFDVAQPDTPVNNGEKAQ